MLPIIDVEATAQRIDSRRIENHLTVRDLQNVFGFSSPQAVYGWIRAKSVPSVDNLVVLASVLQLPQTKKAPHDEVRNIGVSHSSNCSGL